ncbi:MAG TPA: FIST N-terminal domain-containing protein [Rhodoferax sp.]|nr:FIST N-terminal domain-containing protein [Rhodoferax sp.]
MNSRQRLVTLEPGAIAGTLDAWRALGPGMGVMALLPEAEKAHIPMLQQVFRDSGIPLCGAVFPALITDTGFTTSGVWLVCFERMPPHLLIADVRTDGATQLSNVIRQLLPAGAAASPPTVFMVFDGMLPAIGTLLDDVHRELGNSVVYTGVNAGSETFTPMSCLFDQNQCVGFGVLVLLMPADWQVVLHHGYPVSKRLMTATSSTGNRIDTIDNRPALEVYQSVIQTEYGVTLTRENFYDHAVHFPFGVVTAVDVLVRIPVAFTDDGALVCVGEVPPNTLLRLLRAPQLEDSECVLTMAQKIDAITRGVAPPSLLTFYCAGRRMHFGDDAVEEVIQLKAAARTPLLFGALTLGEIDSMEDLDMPRFHNAALVCVPSVSPQ